MIDSLTSNLFDPFFYAETSGVRGTPKDLLRHFQSTGRAAGLSPGPLFDVRFYLLANGDVGPSGISAYDHFVKWGHREGRAPNPLFDAQWYRTNQMSSADPGDAFVHFLRKGRAQGLRPGPLFWPNWYRRNAMNGASGDPQAHYLTSGWRGGRAPNPLFDPKFYFEKYMGDPDCVSDPLAHFVAALADDPTRSPHPLFDGGHFLSGLSKVKRKTGAGALAIYLGAADDCELPDPHPVFDADYYRAGRGENCGPLALVDYVEAGEAALVDPHPLFSKSFYYRSNPDVLSRKRDALTHYLSSGQAEGRPFHPLFDVSHFCATTGRSKASLSEYVRAGTDGRRTIRRPETPDRKVRQRSDLLQITDVPMGHPLVSGGRMPGSVGIFAHIFHVDCAGEMFAACNNAPAGLTRVFVSTDSPGKARDIEAIARTCLDHRIEIRVCPNRGRDIAPFVVGFADRLTEVEVGCHIHSKRSLHYDGGNADWRRYLLNATLGSSELVRNNLEILGCDGIGAVTPDHFLGVADLIQWGGNFETARALAKMMGEDIARDGLLDFPAGSMFWFRTDALRPLLDLRLSTLHFDPEDGQMDGTLAHAIERLFLFTVEAAGFSYVTARPVPGSGSMMSPAQVSTCGNRLRPMQADLGASAHYLPYTAGYLTRASAHTRPRLNLLIPTADRNKAYAGVSTAIEVFGALRDELADFDTRVIATDRPLEPGQMLLPGFTCTDLDAPDPEVGAPRDIVVDGTRRTDVPIPVRRGDIFMATAWWTAAQARQLKAAQSRHFGTPPGRHVYLVQDLETGFEPWSTAWSLADATYRGADDYIPVVNTPILADYMIDEGYFDEAHDLKPSINPVFNRAIHQGTPKEKLMLLYARPHAARNCLEFLDMTLREALRQDPDLWKGWRFLAIGEDFGATQLAPNSPMEILGRLSISDYGELSSRGALGLSLMVSPHPSYPPLEMAAAGVRVLTNRFGSRDSAVLHENISSFGVFDPSCVAAQLGALARDWSSDPDIGWRARPKVDWFFDGATNLASIAGAAASDIRQEAAAMAEAASAPVPALRVAS